MYGTTSEISFIGVGKGREEGWRAAKGKVLHLIMIKTDTDKTHVSVIFNSK